MTLRAIGLFLFYITASAAAGDYSVIIIGAGPSGVAAASRLLENNITDILILEAEPRIGGRIHSVFFGDAYVELGAQWCHGKTNNVVYQLASNLVSLREDDHTMDLLYSAGALDEEFKTQLMELLLEDHLEKAERGNISLQDFVFPRYEARVKEAFKDDPENLRIALSAKPLLEQFVTSYEGAFYSSNVSAGADFFYADNDTDYSWQGIGYKTILDILIRKIPDESKVLPFHEKLKLNAEVIKIRWDGNEKVAVELEDGSSYQSKRVIFTPSLNVLKQDHEKIFEPKLPTEKVEAIQEVGMDSVMKVHLKFAERWWPDNFTGCCFLWHQEDLLAMKNSSFSWVTSVCCIIPADKNPKVVTAWITGPEVPKIELLSDSEIIRGIEFLLKKFVGNQLNVTAPEQILKSGWHNNRHFRGVYSYQTPKATLRNPSPEVELSKPLSNGKNRDVLCFAGEASHPTFYSTVHGAIESGFREADRIIELTKKS